MRHVSRIGWVINPSTLNYFSYKWLFLKKKKKKKKRITMTCELVNFSSLLDFFLLFIFYHFMNRYFEVHIILYTSLASSTICDISALIFLRINKIFYLVFMISCWKVSFINIIRMVKADSRHQKQEKSPKRPSTKEHLLWILGSRTSQNTNDKKWFN